MKIIVCPLSSIAAMQLFLPFNLQGTDYDRKIKESFYDGAQYETVRRMRLSQRTVEDADRFTKWLIDSHRAYAQRWRAVSDLPTRKQITTTFLNLVIINICNSDRWQQLQGLPFVDISRFKRMGTATCEIHQSRDGRSLVPGPQSEIFAHLSIDTSDTGFKIYLDLPHGFYIGLGKIQILLHECMHVLLIKPRGYKPERDQSLDEERLADRAGFLILGNLELHKECLKCRMRGFFIRYAALRDPQGGSSPLGIYKTIQSMLVKEKTLAPTHPLDLERVLCHMAWLRELYLARGFALSPDVFSLCEWELSRLLKCAEENHWLYQ